MEPESPVLQSWLWSLLPPVKFWTHFFCFCCCSSIVVYNEIPLHIGQNGHHKQINKQQVLARLWRKENPPLLVGMQTGAATVENSMEFPQNTKYGTSFWPSNSTAGIIPYEPWNTNSKEPMDIFLIWNESQFPCLKNGDNNLYSSVLLDKGDFIDV